jgi:hypothetical protein
MDAETNTTTNTEQTGQPEKSIFDTPPEIQAPDPVPESQAQEQTPAQETTPAATETKTENTVKVVPEDVDGDALEKFLKGESDVDPTKAGEKKPAAPEAKTTTQTTEAQPAPVVNKPVARDYTGLTDDEVKIFKGMSNDAYKALFPKYQAFKEVEAKRKELEEREVKIKTAEPKSVYDHERAYELAPAFQEKARVVQVMDFETNYWKEQYAKCEAGEDWQPLETDAQGNYVAGKAQPANPQAKSHLLSKLTLATQYGAQARQELQQVALHYSSRRQELAQGIKSYEKKYFPYFEDLASPHQATIKQVLNAIPEEFRDHPLSPFLAKAMTCIQILNNNNQALSKQIKSASTAKADAKKAGPNLGSINSGNAAGTKGSADVENMTVEQLEKYMKGL